MLDIIDYRNLRYQGETRDKQPHGLGIIMDYNHLFCLALWKQGKICGPAFIVFPDSKIFCGRIKQAEVDGLCCFYLQETIQTFANYSERMEEKRNFISVLPFCRLILQVDHKQQRHPKISSHQRYKPNEGSLQRQLTRLFKKTHNLQQYKTWKDFLLLNFIEPYRKKLHWKQTKHKKFTEYFIGIKYSGLGIKLLLFNEEEDVVRMDGETVISIEMGMFSNQHILNGFGKKVDDLQYFKYQSEGDFGEDESNLLAYDRKARHKQAIHFFLQQLKLSPFFENTFLDLRYIHDLSTIYSKFNVQLVEQTQRIAQVILQKPDQSTIVLAQIQQKRQRRRITPQKSAKSLLSLEYQTSSKLQRSQSNNKSQKSVSHSKKTEIIPLTQIRKEIYSSVQKKNNNHLKRQYLQTNPKPIQKPRESNQKNQYNVQPTMQNYSRPFYQQKQRIKYQNKSPNATVHTQQFPSSLSHQPPENMYRQKDNINFNFIKRQPNIQPVTFKHASPFQAINIEPSRSINTPNNSQYNDRKTITSSQNITQQYKRQPLSRNQTDYKIDTRKNRIFNQRFVYNPVEQNKQKFMLDDSSEVEERLPHTANRPIDPQSDSSVEYQSKMKQNKQLISYFNKAMEDPYSSLEKEENINKILHWTLGNSPPSKKAPGKIRTMKKRGPIEDTQ